MPGHTNGRSNYRHHRGGPDLRLGRRRLGARRRRARAEAPVPPPPAVLNVVVEAISAADRFASNVLGLRSGARGDDLIKGGLGADYVKGGSSADKMYGGDGNDKMGGWTGDDIFFGGAGNDRLSGGDGADEIHGEEGDDIDLDGDASIDKIYGEEGNDFELDGDSGNDLISGGPGDDGGAPTSENLQHHGLRGEGGENQVYGNEGADTIDAQTTLLSALVYCVHRGRFACVVDLAGAREEIFGAMGTTPSLRPTGCKTRSTADRVWTRSSLTIGDSTSCWTVRHDRGLRGGGGELTATIAEG